MNKIQKFLGKLVPKERLIATDLIDKVLKGDFVGLNMTKLKGFENIFRIRKGNLRIIYTKENGRIDLLYIGHKNDTTYNL